MEEDEEFELTEEAETSWRRYLKHFFDNVYPLFESYDISKDTALSVWFINRLRAAIDDTNIGNNT